MGESSPYLCVHRSRFSPNVLPVTVMLLPSIKLFFSKYPRTSVQLGEQCPRLATGAESLTGYAAELIYVLHNIFATRLNVSEERSAL